ncbi:plexin-C1-like, partial [Fundulus heteroclitus]|uniref:plexin-C1-like n=1 Tax=Fundulus heteroclitus TaxID=8078 RepID=UPI00165B3F8A
MHFSFLQSRSTFTHISAETQRAKCPAVHHCLSRSCCLLWVEMLLLLGLLCSIWAEPAQGLEEDGGFRFEGDLRLLTVSNDSVYIATEEKLYQLSHDLVLIHSLTQRGILKNPNDENSQEFYRVSMNGAWNKTFTVNVLLPFVNNDTLISCGATEQNCGFCEVLDLKNISKVLHKELIQVGPLRSISGSVSFLVDVKDSVQTETYILTAIENHTKTEKKTDSCPSDLGMINLHNTNYKQDGDIFSFSGPNIPPRITAKADVEFVDGFQINSTVYLFSNVASGNKPNKVCLVWLQAETSKSETLKSLHGATLRTSDGGEDSKLLASSVIPGGQQVLWSGVFSLDGGPTNTELLLFDISPDGYNQTYTDPDCFNKPKTSNKQSEPHTLKPKVVLLKHNHMRSVLAVRHDGWIVFFIGTTDGLLLKLAVDINHKPTCPKVLYRAGGKHKFPKIHLDQVDPKHVYLQFENKIERVPVSKCGVHQNVKDCLSAQDPHCVWCVSADSCTFKDHCTDSEWLSIPNELQTKMVSHQVMKDSHGKIKLMIQTHLTVEQKLHFNFT